MKTTRSRFEKAVQNVNEDSVGWLRDEFKSILESDKDYTRKADYIGFSILSIDSKITSIDEELKELQGLKKKLKEAKSIALTVGAEVLSTYGIDKIEGAGISSISVSKELNKEIKKLEVLNEDALIRHGYYEKVVDEDAVIDAMNYIHRRELIKDYCRVTTIEASIPAKLKVNKRRAVVDSTINQELIS